jgi:endonuclease YncB( thermonuclease family)
MIKKHAIILAILITLLVVFDIFFISSGSSEAKKEQAVIKRVIDGDTIETADGKTIRLLNINSPEKGSFNAEQAANFLKSFENKTVELEITGTDKYKRSLARIYSLESEYLNLKIVELGLASKFIVQESEIKKFAQAEEEAIKSSLGIWSHSQFFNCFHSDIDYSSEIVYLKSKCGPINMSGWVLKDESRKAYKFSIVLNDSVILHSAKGEDNSTDIFWGAETVWNNDRDTLYLFDKEGNIAHYEPFGY